MTTQHAHKNSRVARRGGHWRYYRQHQTIIYITVCSRADKEEAQRSVATSILALSNPLSVGSLKKRKAPL